MLYPSIGQYTEAIKLAAEAPEDYFATLTTLRAVLDDNGNPVMSSGNFAVVFKMQDTDGKIFALKCFTRDQEDRNESYRLIADELKDVSSPYITNIQYLEKELFVDTNTDENEFPVLLMDWVEGETLDKYIKNHISEPLCLEMLACDFAYLADWLLKQPFAHGDLKPDNILVKDDGSLVLIDYDGMYVPKMRGQKARELGSPDFRHPQRTEDDFDEHIDDFAVVTILLSLKALSLNNKLLGTLNAKDCVLLHAKDFSNLAQSAANQKLQELICDKFFARIYAMFVVVLAEKVMDMAMLESVVGKMDRDEIEYNYMVHLWENCHIIDKPDQSLEIIYCIANKLSNKGHTKAMYFLGVCYFWGFGGAKQSYDKAISLYKESAKQGFSRASFNLGYCLDIGEISIYDTSNTALKWYLKSAEQGEPIAWCSLGQLYEYALKDIENAVECYKKAVAADVVSAYYYLGHCYKYGTGIPKDYAKAVELFEIVITKVNRGEVTFLQSWYGATYYEIGHCYYNGFGVEENIEKAIGFFQEAEVYGNDTAKYVLEFILESAYFDEYNRRPIYKKIPYLENDFTEALNFGEISENTINKSAKRRTFDYHRAIGIIQEAAQRGVPESQIRYGKCLENGFGVEQNYELAEEWYTKAANQGSVTAYICLADLYMNEDYHNLSVAIEWYTKAAEQGAVRAQNSLGFLYSGYGVSDYQKAVYWYTKAAEQGDADAQYNLGEFYEMGRGVVQNYTTAIEWFIKASSEIDIAKVTIGNIYYQEFRNYSKAIEWFSQIDYSIRDFSYFNHNVSFNPLDLADCYVNVGAYDEAIKIYKFFAIQPLQHNFNRTGRFIPRSNNGIIVTSLYNLVCLYGEGKVDEQDYQKALDLFTHAVENGSAEAQFKLGCLYENGKGVEQDYQKALKLFIQSSENGNTDAQVELGRLYENGLGVEQNHQKSLKLYTQAAENGNTEAKFKLALYYGYKHNNYQLAINWIIKALGPRWSWNINNSCKAAYLNETIDLLTKAAEQGNVIAQFNLGVCYDIGYGVKQDSPKAVEWYTRAAEKGNVDAQSRLGSCYENGEGVAKDYAKAVEWYTKAAKQGSEWAQNKIKKLNNVNNDKNANE